MQAAIRGVLGGANVERDLTGQHLGHYKVLRYLGHGGTATIYEALDTTTGGRVALKVLRDDSKQRRFLLEAEALARVQHPHIINVMDFCRAETSTGDHVMILVLEFLDGEDLATTLRHDGPLRWTVVLDYAKQLCRALIAAHDAGVVHCDIKPANCYRVHKTEAPAQIKLLDFGVASFLDPETSACMPEYVPGPDGGPPVLAPRAFTPRYVANELIDGSVYDQRVDIYALGVLVYRLLTNKLPYPPARLYTAPRIEANPAPYPLRRAIPTIEVPEALEAVIFRAIATDPSDRYPDVRTLLTDLEAIETREIRPPRLPPNPLVWGDPAAEDSASMSQTVVAKAIVSDLRQTLPDTLVSDAPTKAPQRPPTPTTSHRWHRLILTTVAGLTFVALWQWLGSFVSP